MSSKISKYSLSSGNLIEENIYDHLLNKLAVAEEGILAAGSTNAIYINRNNLSEIYNSVAHTLVANNQTQYPPFQSSSLPGTSHQSILP